MVTTYDAAPQDDTWPSQLYLEGYSTYQLASSTIILASLGPQCAVRDTYSLPLDTYVSSV